MNPTIHIFPELPPLPPTGQPVLLRIPCTLLRPAARERARNVLQSLLSQWSGLASLPLQETASGPVWSGRLQGASLDISLSYGAGEIWIALLRGGAIGIDVMAPQAMEDAQAVAKLYLGETPANAICQSAEPEIVFAMAWTQREARLKCLKRGLSEWTPKSAHTEAGCTTQPILATPKIAGTLAWKNG
jgi:4'-phosphopantetheinyl transferase